MLSRRSLLVVSARAALALPFAALIGCDRAEAPPAPAQVPTTAPAGAGATPAASPVSSTARARWQRLEPNGSKPPARHDHSTTTDADGRRLYVFGGRAGSSGLADLWTFDFDSNAWRQLQPGGTAPSARWGHNAAFDAQRN